jgi:hypothetical protein
VIEAFLYVIGAFLYVIEAFLYVIEAFLYVIGAFLYVIEAFLYVIGAFLYVIEAFLYVIGAFLYVIGAFLYVIGAFLYVIGAFLYVIGAFSGHVQVWSMTGAQLVPPTAIQKLGATFCASMGTCMAWRLWYHHLTRSCRETTSRLKISSYMSIVLVCILKTTLALVLNHSSRHEMGESACAAWLSRSNF